jgi:Tol biopolymer transport system component
MSRLQYELVITGIIFVAGLEMACSSPAGAITVTPPPEQPQSTATGSQTVLPAPVYFIGQDGQIWRLEADGATISQITHEPAPVTEFDDSPKDGTLAYVSSNALIISDAQGGNRRVMLSGPALSQSPDATYILSSLTKPRWSPDGMTLAYGLGGINLLDVPTGTSRMLRSTTYSETSPAEIRIYVPDQWSPDGTRLLVHLGFSEGGGLVVLRLADHSEVLLTSPDGLVCCYQAWATDGLNIYFANDSVGYVASGLWRADVVSGTGVTLIAGEQDGKFTLVSYPYQGADGRLYAFMSSTSEFPEAFPALVMTRSAADGVTERMTLRTDTWHLGDVLWAQDGSGALIIDQSPDFPRPDPFAILGPLVWLPTDGSPALVLPVVGTSLHWGR